MKVNISSLNKHCDGKFADDFMMISLLEFNYLMRKRIIWDKC